MAFTCPECLTGGALSISTSITLPPDSRSDDILLQLVRCRHCGFFGAAIYQESRRGGFDSESWDHRGYRLETGELAELKRLIGSCPSKKNKGCACSAHVALGKQNEYGRWLPPMRRS
jgi:hypothetical protein